MKKWLSFTLLLTVLLCGCGNMETLETVADDHIQPSVAAPQQMALDIPEDAVIAAMESEENGCLYFCDDYTLTMQTLEAGDVDKTLRLVTGYEASQLRVIETSRQGAACYDFVWVSAGEEEEQVCRGTLLDDGEYHYVLTCMADASKAYELQQQWQRLTGSLCLTLPGEDPYTGS